MSNTNPLFDEAQQSLVRMQQFDVTQLPRERELGSELNFLGAVEPATRLISLYKRLATTALEDISKHGLQQIRDRANSDFAILNQSLQFKIAQQNPHTARDSLIKQLSESYEPTFQVLHPYIAYSLHRAADFQRLDSDARATMQSIVDKADKIEGQLQEHEKEANRILGEIRAVAAEEGVTQQSIHFRNEAEKHDNESHKWQQSTTKYALLLGCYAIVSVFLHKIPFLAPVTTYDAIQLSISKVLVFSVIGFLLYLSARNFLNHKHNAIVNRHRQNALMTHRALIEAATEPGIREAIMVQAAGCIFSPQSTDYANGFGNGEGGGAKPVIELLTKGGEKGE